ncbi:diguanylate cyclase [Vibrio sp. JC009]|uniref:GGDEF domain-containing response regulator n=1 Tax=Vibrio sp. JC009 TaxID=2912314 RepID=UPI0023AEF958|nr:response regulator [Vibrio sp. JC009]WED22460.1 diguanylate cyclase [Vibrio sp. JC009]
MQEKVLIVEDSETYRNYLASQIATLNYEVVQAKTYAQAKEIMQHETNFLCAVTDLCLPDAEDGEIVDLAHQYDLKVIVITANFDDQIRQHFIAKGIVDYIIKENISSVTYLLTLLNRLNKNKWHKALVVDDSRPIRHRLVQLLEHQYIRTVQAENGEQAIQKMKENPDITFIITDHNMPVKDGITMTRELRRKYDRNQLVILGLSGTESESLTAKFLKAGANDYLKKPFNQEELFCRVQNLLNMKDSSDELYKMANQDSLTGLWNRRYLFQHADTSKEQCNVAMMDIDFFKKINDKFGHEGGDQALRTVSHIITIYFNDDLAARVGGEEFCVVNYGDFDSFVKRLEHLRTRIENTAIPFGNSEIRVTISIGATKAKRNIDTMMSIADERLYQAKKSGRNQLISS